MSDEEKSPLSDARCDGGQWKGADMQKDRVWRTTLKSARSRPADDAMPSTI